MSQESQEAITQKPEKESVAAAEETQNGEESQKGTEENKQLDLTHVIP